VSAGQRIKKLFRRFEFLRPERIQNSTRVSVLSFPAQHNTQSSFGPRGTGLEFEAFSKFRFGLRIFPAFKVCRTQGKPDAGIQRLELDCFLVVADRKVPDPLSSVALAFKAIGVG